MESSEFANELTVTEEMNDVTSEPCVDMHYHVTEDGKRGGKRDREDASSDESWIIQGKGRKQIRASTQSEKNEKTQVSVTSDNVLPKQFALARLFKDNKIKSIHRVKYIHAYKMLLTFDEEVCADIFINCQAFADLGWRCQKTSEVSLSYGVIKDVDMDLTEIDIKKNLFSDVEIVSVKRLKKRNTDSSSKEAWVHSESVRLGFKGSRLPHHVAILGMKVKVEPYVFPVTQCSRCWKFGHNSIRCPSKKVICPKCTKNHANCELVQANYRCVNCTGNHMALQRSCPVFRKERRIRELMSEFNCTYKQALNMYVPPSPVSVRSRSPGGDFPSLNVQIPTAIQTPVPPPAQNIKLMSDLFKPSEQAPASASKSSRRTIRRARAAATTYAPTPNQSAPPDDDDWYIPENQRDIPGPLDNNENENKCINRSSFIKLLIRLKNIILNKESFESKIHQCISITAEWIMSKIGTNISVSSLMSTFMNVIINEYG